MANSSSFETLLAQYDYPLSEDMIATRPASPRDSSKFLCYRRSTDTIETDRFRNIGAYLPKGTLLVFNDTKVIPARLPGVLKTGGKVELLCIKFDGPRIEALCERFLPVGERIRFSEKVSAVVIGKTGSVYALTLEGSTDIRSLLAKGGKTPLPPYLKRSALTERERRQKYQSIFAKNDGSIAAPTASLHFTKRLLRKLEKHGIKFAHVTLHVSLGTFMPLSEAAIQSGELHEEQFEISKQTLAQIKKAKAEGRPVIPVGTTALRAIESAFAGRTNSTKLFIREGYEFKVADGLITNFHVPRSSLMMLVAALVGREKLLELYNFAMRENFRFLSFGDAMLIL